MAKTKYNLHLKGYVGGWNFGSDYVDYVLNKNSEKEVSVLIDSLGGQLNTALSSCLKLGYFLARRNEDIVVRKWLRMKSGT